MDRAVQLLGHWLWARVALLVIAASVLAVDLGGPGLWEPNELAVADKAVQRSQPPPATPKAAPAKEPAEKMAPTPAAQPQQACPRTAPSNDGARTLTEQLAAQEPTDRGMRRPLVILGLLTIAGIAGLGFRFGGTRAGVLAGLVCLSFPLLVLQSRQLTSEIGTAAGATLVVYALAFPLRPARGGWFIADAIIAAIALAAGAWIAFLGGGALLGLLVPLGAVAIATGFGWYAVREAERAKRRGPDEIRRAWLAAAVAIVAAAATVLLVIILAVQIYDVRAPGPGKDVLLGKTLVPRDCWSTALGGVWKTGDDLGATYDVTFEQIAFGTFPWGLAAPIAIALLFASRRRIRRHAAALTLAWAAAAWIATLAFQRKVGFSIYAGFPAMALAVGLWLDQLFDRLADPSVDEEGPRIGLLAGLFVFLGALTLGKDLQTFPERLTALLVGHDAIKYPKGATLLAVPVKAWVLVLGACVALAFALSLWLWRPGPAEAARRARRRARTALVAALAGTIGLAAFWSHGWQRTLSKNLSSKQIFATYRELARPGEPLGILGDMGNAPRYYAGGTFERIANRDQLMPFLQRTDGKRVFALAPASELCAFHRAAAGRPYYVLDNTNPRTLLMSNKLGAGARDHNPLAEAMLRTEPRGIAQRPPSPIVFDGKIELIGWSVPAKVNRGEEFTTTLYFKVLQPVSGAWKVVAHFDPQASAPRLTQDHDPIGNRCPTSQWQRGDYVVDKFVVDSSKASTGGPHAVYVGFWPGGNRERMKVSAAPSGTIDADRVRIGSVLLQ